MPGLANMPVIDRDEAHFAQASRQMVQTGNYFQIRFQDHTRFQKPPGINWLQAASVKLFSKADARAIWPYRIPSLLGALLSVLLTYFFSRRFVGRDTALFAAALLASSLLLVVEAHMAVIDTSLLSSVLLMQGALWIIYQEGMDKKKASWAWALCFWLALAYGFVLKGVTPLVAVLSIATLCLIERQVKWLAGLRIVSGLLLFILLSLAWLMMVNHAEHSNYLLQMFHKDLLPKLQGGHESHGKPPLFHLAILPLTSWPASLFLWQGGVYAFFNRHAKLVRFLLAWILPTWIFFELMPTKLPQYVLPTFPAIALFCALSISDLNQAKPGKWMHFLHILWTIISIALALSLACIPLLLQEQMGLISYLLFITIAFMSILAVCYAWKGIYKRAAYTILAMALITYPLIFEGLLPRLQSPWLTSKLVQLIDNHKISREKPLVVVGFEEPSLVFNLNTYLVQFTDSQAAAKILQADPSRIAVVESSVFEAWHNQQNDLTILTHTKGFNYSKGRWLELFVVGRKVPLSSLW